MQDLQTISRELMEKREGMAEFIKSWKGADGKGLPTDDQAAELRKRNDELTEIGKKFTAIKQVEDIAAENEDALKSLRTVSRPNFGGDAEPESRGDRAVNRKSLGEMFCESDAYKRFAKGSGQRTDYVDLPLKSVKATFDTAGATLTAYDRQPGIVLIGLQKVTVRDLLSAGETTMPTIRYVREDTFTNAAATVAEGATKPEASWDTSEVDAPVRKIAVTSKVTDEILADFPAIRDYINSRLPLMVMIAEEAQLISGDGVSPNITGLLNTAGIQTQATGGDVNVDAIYKGIVKVRTIGFFEPDGVVIHPDNWTPIRLQKTTTGEYVWGAPSEVGPERVWGLVTDVTTGITANTALVGAYKLGAQVFQREGVRIEATNSNEDDFKKNLIAIRVEERLALAVYRPKAFCKVTGLGTAP